MRTAPMQKFFRSLTELCSVHPRSLALARGVLGLFLTLTYLNYIPLLDDYFSDTGILGRTEGLEITRGARYSLYMIGGHWAVPYVILSLSIVASLALMAGIYSRLAAVASLIFFTSLATSTAPMVFGLHDALLCFIFWAIFLPYDRIPQSIFSRRPDADAPFFSLTALGMVLTSFSMLFGGGIVKLRNFDFWIGSANSIESFATYYTNVNIFSWMAVYFPAVARTLARLTVVTELAIVLILFIPFMTEGIRKWEIAYASLFFLCASLCIHVGVFPMVPLVGMYVMVPPGFWRNRFILRVIAAGESTDSMHGHYSESTGRKIIARIVRPLYAFFIICYAISIWNHYCPYHRTVLQNRLDSGWIGTALQAGGLSGGWDFMYGGMMRNRFLLVEYRSPNGAFYENITYVPFRWPMFNYPMNYANAIMRAKDNSPRVKRYTDSLCAKSAAVFPFAERPAAIGLYDIDDSENHLRALPQFDQRALRRAVAGNLPFYVSECSGRDPIRPELNTRVDLPLTTSQFPVLSWMQEFGALQLNRSVDKNRITLGGITYARGIGTHADATIRVSVTGSKRFSAIAGIDGERKTSRFASAMIVVSTEKGVLYQSPVLTAASAPVQISVPTSGANVLTLKVYGRVPGNQDHSIRDDHVSFANIILE